MSGNNFPNRLGPKIGRVYGVRGFLGPVPGKGGRGCRGGSEADDGRGGSREAAEEAEEDGECEVAAAAAIARAANGSVATTVPADELPAGFFTKGRTAGRASPVLTPPTRPAALEGSGGTERRGGLEDGLDAAEGDEAVP